MSSTTEQAGRLRYVATKVGRHVHWARTQGVRRLVEEDQLDPVARARTAWEKARWRRAHGIAPGQATPVFLVGVQRSGTNMVVRGLERCPEFEVHNENDGRVFERFELRPLPVVRAVVEASGHRFVLFKPLCDSHRTDDLLDRLGSTTPGRAIWAYRDVDGRVRSSLAKFGASNLDVLREMAAGQADGRWQAQRISPVNRDLIRGFDYTTMTPESASALFWYLRNSLYFDLGLDRRDDVTLVSYDALVADPEPTMRSLCGFLGFPYQPALIAGIDHRASGRPPLDLDPRIRVACTDLGQRLAAAAGQSGADLPTREVAS